MAVRDRSHDRTDCHAVKSVVDKDQKSHQDRRQLRAYPALDPPGRPVAKSLCTAGLIHENDKSAKDRDEDQDTGMRQVCEIDDKSAVRMEHKRIERKFQVSVRVQQRPYQDTDKERTVHLFGNKRENDRNNGGKQRPRACVNRRNIVFRHSAGGVHGPDH